MLYFIMLRKGFNFSNRSQTFFDVCIGSLEGFTKLKSSKRVNTSFLFSSLELGITHYY